MNRQQLHKITTHLRLHRSPQAARTKERPSTNSLRGESNEIHDEVILTLHCGHPLATHELNLAVSKCSVAATRKLEHERKSFQR